MACHLISRVSLPTLPCSIFLHISTLHTGPLELTLLTSPTKMDTPGGPSRHLCPVYLLGPGLDWSQPLWVPALTDTVELRFPFTEQLFASHRPPPELYKGGTLLPLALKGHLLVPGSLPRALPFLNLHSLSIYSCVQTLQNLSGSHQKVLRHGVSFPLATTMHAVKEQQRWTASLASLDRSKTGPACRMQMLTCCACNSKNRLARLLP